MKEKVLINNVLILLCFLTTWSCNSNRETALQDSNKKHISDVKVNVSLETSNDDSLIVLCQIMNDSIDSLLFIAQPFLVESDVTDKNHVWVLTGDRFTSPNILYIEKENDKMLFESDGEYKFIFDSMPQLIITPPKGILTIRIYLNSRHSTVLVEKKYKFFGAIVYANKKEADLLINNYAETIRNLYTSRLVVISNIGITALNYDNFSRHLYEPKKNYNDLSISQFIWTTFRYKVGF